MSALVPFSSSFLFPSVLLVLLFAPCNLSSLCERKRMRENRTKHIWIAPFDLLSLTCHLLSVPRTQIKFTQLYFTFYFYPLGNASQYSFQINTYSLILYLVSNLPPKMFSLINWPTLTKCAWMIYKHTNWLRWLRESMRVVWVLFSALVALYGTFIYFLYFFSLFSLHISWSSSFSLSLLIFWPWIG